MFGGRRRRSSNVKVMQLFHELKQQFPTIPDHIVTACITSFVQSNAQGKATSNVVELLEAALAENNSDQMGRPSQQFESPSLEEKPNPENTYPRRAEEVSATANPPYSERLRADDMNDSASDINRNLVKANNETAPKRPNHLDIKSETFNSFNEEKRKFNIQLSEKCKDVHKLLNSKLSEKPPRSPSAKRSSAKNSPIKSEKPSAEWQKRSQEEIQRRLSQETPSLKKETCSTPTQTTDTLLGSPNVNLSLNVNCSLDLVQNPNPLPRHKALVQITPTQPWLQAPTPTSASSPRSYTSVNFTLRPPASTPQSPIDITSQNSSLTYSTSSFDSQKGLQSRLQITVGPGSGSVSTVRVRPRSYHSDETQQEEMPARAGSLNNLAVSTEPPVILKQQARLERLRIELNSEKARLVIMKQEIADLEKNRLKKQTSIDKEVEKQLLMEIRHLRCQCKELELDGEAFYSNIYTGPRGPLTQASSPRLRAAPNHRTNTNRRAQPSPPQPLDEEGPKWNCAVCTFLNHPFLNACEQCSMPRILHGTRPLQAINTNITLNALRKLNVNQAAHTTRSISLNNVPNRHISRPIGFVLDDRGQNVALNSRVTSSRSVPNMLQGNDTVDGLLFSKAEKPILN